MNQRSGFILIIVLGLLGVMAFLALHFAEVAHTTRILGVAHMDKGRSRLMARSGVERAVMQVQDASAQFGISDCDFAIGGGTHAPMGDRAIYSVRDMSSSIDLNDGIAAGMAEWGGTGKYRADTLDWDLEEAPPPGPEQLLETIPDFYVFNNMLPYGDDSHLYLFPIPVNRPRVGDKLKGVNPPFVGVEFTVGSVVDPDGGGYSLTLGVNGSLDALNQDGTQHAFELWGVPSVPSPPMGDATRINVRLRTLLNAYGDVHKFVAQMGSVDANYGLIPFQYSSTTLVPYGHAVPSVDIRNGKYIYENVVAKRWGRGLGDRVVCSRPMEGYKSVSEVEDIVNTWAAETLTPGYPASGTFYNLIKHDLAVGNVPDASYTRLGIQQWVSDLEPNCSEFGTRDVVQGPTFVPNMFSPMHINMRPPNMANIFKRHPVIPINLSGAGIFTRAAVFAALVNVGYLCESSRSFLYNNGSASQVALGQNSIGVSGPVLKRPLFENGVDALPNVEDFNDGLGPVNVNHAAALFMSVRDAYELSKGYAAYGFAVDPPRNFDEFRDALLWHQVNGPGYEKCEPMGTPYNPDPVTGGWFTQDYVALTLPHVLSRVIRMPGYMGAPQALLSPAYAINGYESHPSNAQYAEHAGSHPTRKTEDFVSRYLLPKVQFLPSGVVSISCRGRVLNPQGEERSATTIQALLELMSTVALRSQKQFVEATVGVALPPMPATSTSIMIGPEAFIRNAPDPDIQSPDYPHTCLGVVGLKDFEEPLVGSPQFIAHFNGHVTGDPGVSKIFMVSGDASTGFVESDPITGGYVGRDPANDMHLPNTPDLFSHIFLGNYEGASRPLFTDGCRGTNLSPFGGAWSSSIDSQCFNTSEKERDFLFLRPMNPHCPNTLLANGQVVGLKAGKGYMSAWVRLPSGHEGVSDPEKSLARNDARMNFKVLAHYNVIERDLIAPNALFTTSMIVGLGYDDKIRRYVIHVRYGTRGVPATCFGIWPASAGVPIIALGNPANAGSNPLFDFDNSTILCNYLSPLYTSWRTQPGWHFDERWVVMKDPVAFPECGAGTWHKISVGWNSHFYEPDPQKNLWIKLHDGSNTESQGLHNWGGSTGQVKGIYSDFANLHSHDYMFCLGNTYSLDYNIKRGSFNGSVDMEGYDYAVPDNNASGNVWGREEVTHHLDSLFDNVTLELGTPPVETTDPPRRYDVTTEPDWILDPNIFLPKGARLKTVGARIYDPRDSSKNFPTVDLDLLEGDPLVGLSAVVPSKSVDGGNPALQRTEHLRFYAPRNLAPSTRLRLKYRNHRPDGSPLVGDGSSDDWTEIPWIMEVMVRYDEGTAAKILQWQQE